MRESAIAVCFERQPCYGCPQRDHDSAHVKTDCTNYAPDTLQGRNTKRLCELCVNLVHMHIGWTSCKLLLSSTVPETKADKQQHLLGDAPEA